MGFWYPSEIRFAFETFTLLTRISWWEFYLIYVLCKKYFSRIYRHIYNHSEVVRFSSLINWACWNKAVCIIFTDRMVQLRDQWVWPSFLQHLSQQPFAYPLWLIISLPLHWTHNRHSAEVELVAPRRNQGNVLHQLLPNQVSTLAAPRLIPRPPL